MPLNNCMSISYQSFDESQHVITWNFLLLFTCDLWLVTCDLFVRHLCTRCRKDLSLSGLVEPRISWGAMPERVPAFKPPVRFRSRESVNQSNYPEYRPLRRTPLYSRDADSCQWYSGNACRKCHRSAKLWQIFPIWNQKTFKRVCCLRRSALTFLDSVRKQGGTAKLKKSLRFLIKA
jgi:hypothetical protein